MRRFVAWIGGAVGGLAAYRLVRRRAETEAWPEPTPAGPDERAEELRAKLAEARGDEEAPVEPSETVAAEAAPPAQPESLEERRRRVHEEGRAAIDEMQSD